MIIDLLSKQSKSPLLLAYIEIYESIASQDVSAGSPAFQSELELAQRAKMDARKIGNVSGLKILEIGPGYGHLAKELTERGATVSVADLVPHYMERILIEIKGRAYLMDIQQSPMDLDQEFDLIIMCDVLEHVFRPADALLTAQLLLKPGGKLYVRSPSHESLITYACSLGYPIEIVHLRTYTKSLLEMELRAAGFINIKGPKKLPKSMFVPRNLFARSFYWKIVRREAKGLPTSNVQSAIKLALHGRPSTRYGVIFKITRPLFKLISKPSELASLATKPS